MEDETGMKDTMGMPDSTDANAAGDPQPAEGQRGPTWRGWVLSILVAIILSVTATLLLGGSFRPGRAVAGGAGGVGCGAGAGSGCCPPADAGK